ncbi:MAG: hypothetical protein HPY68_04655 [Candidatus Atribacteria bacterium]|nr:hypothetical protein [Candidatus Atribacteria bacterium]
MAGLSKVQRGFREIAEFIDEEKLEDFRVMEFKMKSLWGCLYCSRGHENLLFVRPDLPEKERKKVVTLGVVFSHYPEILKKQKRKLFKGVFQRAAQFLSEEKLQEIKKASRGLCMLPITPGIVENFFGAC